MKPEWKQYAPVGLYIAGIAVLATGILYFIEREVNIYVQISLGLIVIGLALFVMLDPTRTRQSMTGRQARYGSNAFVMILAFAGILTVINYIAYQNPKEWDITEDKSNTLSEDSLSIIDSLEEPVLIVGFYEQGSEGAESNTREQLDKYVVASGGMISYEFYDHNTDLGKAQEYGVSQDGTVVFTMGDKKDLITFVNEKEISGALLKLLSGEVQTIYFLAGHDEIDIEDFGEDSYSAVRQALTDKNYVIKTLSLQVEKAIPADADLLIIARPRYPLFEDEIVLIREFMNEGGSLIVLKNPVIQNLVEIESTSIEETPDPLDAYLAEDWGIFLRNDLVVDRQTETGFDVFADSYANFHPITEKLESIITVYLRARSVTFLEGNPDINGEVLVYSAGESPEGLLTWAETDVNSLLTGDISLDDSDFPGPISLAVAAENNATNARIVVFGDAEFTIDALFNQYANGRMMINSIDWAAEQENLIDLTAREETQRFMPLLTARSLNLAVFMAACFVPGIVAAAGVSVYIGRRKRT